MRDTVRRKTAWISTNANPATIRIGADKIPERLARAPIEVNTRKRKRYPILDAP